MCEFTLFEYSAIRELAVSYFGTIIFIYHLNKYILSLNIVGGEEQDRNFLGDAVGFIGDTVNSIF